MIPDKDGMERLGLTPESIIGARVSECGFDAFERDDGVHPEGPAGRYDPDGGKGYNKYLNDRGYPGENPWHDYANSAIDDDDNVVSGWFLKNSSLPANIDEQDSETPYLTRRAMEFIDGAEGPWCCHLSYIKPHWPYIAPEPYASMYGAKDIVRAVRSDAEFENAHPFLKGLMKGMIGTAFAKDEVRNAVIPAYMGLIKQCDDQLGVLLDHLEETGRMDDTMIVLTADHGDFLGDHWLGEKMFYHDASTRVPLIIYDPSEAADGTRGTVSDALVQAIDLAPTFLDVAGGAPVDHILEGKSLLPILHGEAEDVGYNFVICEADFSASLAAGGMGLDTQQAVTFMIADKKWKMIHFESGDRSILFDLESDPDELTDLGDDPAYAEVIATLYEKLFAWARRPSQRTTISREKVMGMRRAVLQTGVLVGVPDEDSYPKELTAKYRGLKAKPYQTLVNK